MDVKSAGFAQAMMFAFALALQLLGTAWCVAAWGPHSSRWAVMRTLCAQHARNQICPPQWLLNGTGSPVCTLQWTPLHRVQCGQAHQYGFCVPPHCDPQLTVHVGDVEQLSTPTVPATAVILSSSLRRYQFVRQKHRK
jgi:hypothetical protein